MLPVKAKRTVVLGTGPVVAELLREAQQRPRCRYQIIGVVSGDKKRSGEYHGFPLLGSLDALSRILLEHRIELVLIASPGQRSARVDQQLLEAKVCRRVRIELAQTAYEQLSGKVPIESTEMGELIHSDHFQPRPLTMRAQRLLSFIIGLVGTLVLAPLLALIAVLIKLDSSGPVLFVQERVGMAGRRFRLYKFRSMRPEQASASEWEGDNTHRITRVGKWLRRTRLDELPQFFNLIRGDMNIVGPRPHPASNFELFVLAARNLPECGVQVPFYTIRSSVRPGITGWAQVRYRYANNLDEELEKLRFDLYYLKHYSLALDMQILFETALMALGWNRGTPAAPAPAQEPPLEWENKVLLPVRERVANESKY